MVQFESHSWLTISRRCLVRRPGMRSSSTQRRVLLPIQKHHGRQTMTRIARRKLLTTVPVAWPPSWRPDGRPPSPRSGERPLAALDRFRAGIRRAAQEPDRAGMQEGDGHHPQGRDGQCQRPAVAHHLGDPVRKRRGHHHGDQQLAAALRRQPGRCERRGRGDRQGTGRLLRRLPAGRHGRQQVDRRAVDGRRRADRLSQILVRGGRATTASPRTGIRSAMPARS